jgi:EamA domain-containing membrane protein RarD
MVGRIHDCATLPDGPGAVLAYAAFVWLLTNASVSTVSTYAYVNPSVALLLGWMLLDERITVGTAAGALLIILAVVVVVDVEGATRTAKGKTMVTDRSAV